MPIEDIEQTLPSSSILTTPEGGPQLAPTERDHELEKEKRARLGISELRELPGTYANTEYVKELGQQDWRQNMVDGFNTNMLTTIARKISDEGVMGLFGFREEGEPYDKAKALASMPDHYTRDQIAGLLDEDTAGGFARAKKRLDDELRLGAAMTKQHAGAGLSQLVGQVLDLDMIILTPVAGAALGAARLAKHTNRQARLAGFGQGAADRITGIVQGTNVGAQIGAMVGLTDLTQKEAATWQDAATVFLGSTIFGTAVGGATKMNAQLGRARDELKGRVVRDDPDMNSELDVEIMHQDGDVIPEEVWGGPVEGVGDDLNIQPDSTIVGGGQSTAGATSIGGGAQGPPLKVLNDPNGPIPKDQGGLIDMAYRWRHASGWGTQKAQDARKAWTKVITSKLGSIGVSDWMKMYQSKSAVMNYLAGVLFESPSGLGRGRATAATVMEMYHHLVQTHIGRHIDPLMNSWAKRNGHTWHSSGYFISREGRRAFNRELALEMNSRLHKRSSSPSDEIAEAADRYDVASADGVSIGKGKPGQRALDGAEHWEPTRGWTPYKWMGSEINRIIRLGVKRPVLIKALGDGYRSAGMAVGKDADAVAEAVVQRALARHEGMDASTASLMTGDGREWMEGSLRMTNKLSEADIQRIMERMVGTLEERSREGFAKSRNNIDLNVAIPNDMGLDLKLVDLIDQDFHRSWQRYSRQLSGAAALARVGITNRAQRKTMVLAAQAEQRALGEAVVDADMLYAQLSHFNGGPTHGYAMGATNEGINPIVAIAKRIANLGLLEKLGITQLGETGVGILQVGVVNWWRRGPMSLIDKELRNANKALLNDLAYVTGELGRDERHFAEWLDLDEISLSDRAEWVKAVSAISSNAAFVQAYTSGFNTVRRHQQRIVLSGMIDKVFRTIKEGDIQANLARFESDFGLGMDEINYLRQLVDDGTIEFADRGFVNKINIDRWDDDMSHIFGSSMVRNMNQTVQKAMAGEQDAWMHTDWGTVMTHLMTFPMLAFQKQFLRNARHMDGQAVGQMMAGLATSFLAVNIRDVLDGRERSLEDKAIAAFGYNNMSSWIPMTFDPTMTALGLDDLRINPYGPHASILPPVISQMDALRRVPGATAKWLTGNADYYDRQAMKALPFAGTYIFSQIFDKPDVGHQN